MSFFLFFEGEGSPASALFSDCVSVLFGTKILKAEGWDFDTGVGDLGTDRDSRLPFDGDLSKATSPPNDGDAAPLLLQMENDLPDQIVEWRIQAKLMRFLPFERDPLPSTTLCYATIIRIFLTSGESISWTRQRWIAANQANTYFHVEERIPTSAIVGSSIQNIELAIMLVPTGTKGIDGREETRINDAAVDERLRITTLWLEGLCEFDTETGFEPESEFLPPTAEQNLKIRQPSPFDLPDIKEDSPTLLPPDPPVAPITAPANRTLDGKKIEPVPFTIDTTPKTLTVAPDRKTGFYSGDFEVGVFIKPGPARARMQERQDLILVRAEGANVTSDLRFQPPSQVTPVDRDMFVQIDPNVFALRTGFLHFVTGVLQITNETTSDQLITVGIDTPEDAQSTVVPESPAVTVRAGSTAEQLLAIRAEAFDEGVDRHRLVLATGPELQGEVDLVLNYAESNLLDVPYHILTGEILTLKIGNVIDIQFRSGDGPQGSESWRVVNPVFLLEHGLTFDQNGLLSSDGVVGSPSSVALVFIAMTRTTHNERLRAAKVITLRVVN